MISVEITAGGGKRERIRYCRYAKATFRKDRRLNIRLSSKDLEAIQKRALAEGLPYQTFDREPAAQSTRPGGSKRSEERLSRILLKRNSVSRLLAIFVANASISIASDDHVPCLMLALRILADPDRPSRLDLSAIEPEPLAVVTLLPVVPSSL